MDASDDGGFAPLHLAASNNNVEIAKLLIEAGCSIDQTNQYAWTPLHIACQGGAANKELISLLLQSGYAFQELSSFSGFFANWFQCQ